MLLCFVYLSRLLAFSFHLLCTMLNLTVDHTYRTEGARGCSYSLHDLSYWSRQLLLFATHIFARVELEGQCFQLQIVLLIPSIRLLIMTSLVPVDRVNLLQTTSSEHEALFLPLSDGVAAIISVVSIVNK